MTTFDQMGIKGSDVFRMLSNGVFDVGMTVADYVVGDAPALQGVDVPLVATTADQAHAMIKAARPMVDDIMKQQFNAKVLAIAPYPPQVVFCKGDIKSLADLKGKKVRGSGRMTTVSCSRWARPGSIFPSLKSRVPFSVGSSIVRSPAPVPDTAPAGMKVSDSLLPIPLGGWDPVITAMNMNTWNSLSPKMQSLITSEDQNPVRGTGLERRSRGAEKQHRLPDRQRHVHLGQAGPHEAGQYQPGRSRQGPQRSCGRRCCPTGLHAPTRNGSPAGTRQSVKP